jgi:hypothetical protein
MDRTGGGGGGGGRIGSGGGGGRRIGSGGGGGGRIMTPDWAQFALAVILLLPGPTGETGRKFPKTHDSASHVYTRHGVFELVVQCHTKDSRRI